MLIPEFQNLVSKYNAHFVNFKISRGILMYIFQKSKISIASNFAQIPQNFQKKNIAIYPNFK